MWRERGCRGRDVEAKGVEVRDVEAKGVEVRDVEVKGVEGCLRGYMKTWCGRHEAQVRVERFALLIRRVVSFPDLS